mgnify:FL=1|jgi:hypothetical protein
MVFSTHTLCASECLSHSYDLLIQCRKEPVAHAYLIASYGVMVITLIMSAASFCKYHNFLQKKAPLARRE